MTPILPREILRIIYLLVREQEERPQRYRQLVDPKTLETVRPRHSTFIALARVDMFAYQTVTNEIFRPDRFLSRSRHLPTADVLLDALTQINTEDKGKGFGGGWRPTFDDPHVYPYLLRYHNLRRVTHVRIPTFRALALPDLVEVKAFLAHIGEPGPLMRNVELSFAFNPTAADLTTSIRREWLELYAALFQPRLVVFEQIYDLIDTSLGSPIFAIARCFKHTPVRVYVRNAHVLVNGPRTRVQSADTHVQYICHEPQIDPAFRDPMYLDSLFEFLRFHAISRPHSSSVKVDVVLPGSKSAEVSKLASRLVDAEKREGPYRPRTVQIRSETSPTGYTERLRDVRLLTRFDSLGV